MAKDYSTERVFKVCVVFRGENLILSTEGSCGSKRFITACAPENIKQQCSPLNILFEVSEITIKTTMS